VSVVDAGDRLEENRGDPIDIGLGIAQLERRDAGAPAGWMVGGE
jgi:hypothetical protein